MTKRKLFLAGASGAIGRRLTPMLVREGWHVVAMTRSSDRAEALRRQGIEAVIADAFDADAVRAAVTSARPEIVMHQMTDLPRDLAKLDDDALARNALLRKVGTGNLVRASEAAGARRLVAQSIAFSYAPGRQPHTETDTLAGRLPGASASALGVTALEDQVSAAAMDKVVLRYGRLYGPGTGSDCPWGRAAIHVDAAAKAAALAAAATVVGVYNVAEDDGDVDSARARSELGWSEHFRLTPQP